MGEERKKGRRKPPGDLSSFSRRSFFLPQPSRSSIFREKDPTRASVHRERSVRALCRRCRGLRGAGVELSADEDGLGEGARGSGATLGRRSRRWFSLHFSDLSSCCSVHSSTRKPISLEPGFSLLRNQLVEGTTTSPPSPSSASLLPPSFASSPSKTALSLDLISVNLVSFYYIRPLVLVLGSIQLNKPPSLCDLPKQAPKLNLPLLASSPPLSSLER